MRPADGCPSGRTKLPVVTYLVLIFGASVVALGALVGTTTVANFNSERNRVVTSLRSGAELAAGAVADSQRQTLDYMGPMVDQPAVKALEPSSCNVAFGGFASLMANYGHMRLVDSDGAVICSLLPKGVQGTLPRQDWAARLAAAGGPGLADEPAPDPLTGKLSRTMVMPVEGTGGRNGFFVMVGYLSSFQFEVPASLPQPAPSAGSTNSPHHLGHPGGRWRP